MENVSMDSMHSTVDSNLGGNMSRVGDFTTPITPDVTNTAYKTEAHIWIYSAPCLLVLGIVGNLLTILVMNRKRMRGTSTSVYLTMLAAGDMTVVVSGLIPEWLGQMEIVEIWNTHPWVCKVEMYVYYTALDFAIWMLVAFSCDRVIAVRFPLQRRQLSTPRGAMATTAFIFLLANVNVHVFWSKGARYGDDEALVSNCKYLDGFDYFKSKILPILVLAFALIGPFLIIAIGNVVILCTVKTARQTRIQLSMRSERMVRRHYGQTTLMCLITSVVFMVLVLPSIVLLIGKTYWQTYPKYWLSRAVANQLVYLNHSVNFLLYALTGSRFRFELKAMFARRKEKGVFESSSSGRSTRLTVHSLMPRNERTVLIGVLRTRTHTI
jgi:hypothetical protein